MEHGTPSPTKASVQERNHIDQLLKYLPSEAPAELQLPREPQFPPDPEVDVVMDAMGEQVESLKKAHWGFNLKTSSKSNSI